jgi:hypothetical protein
MPRPLLLAVLVLVAVLAAACSEPPAEVSSTRSAAAVEPSDVPSPDVAPARDATATTPTEGAHDGHGAHADEAATDQAHGDAGAPSALPTADELIERTRIHLEQWRDVGAAEAAGYRSIGDAFTGWEHLVQPEWAADDAILDPARPESLVYRVDGEQRELVSAMYLLPPGATMDDVPDLGDERATWHIHDDLCFDEEGRLAGVLRDGECLFGGEHRVTAPMMHVWIVEHPCGPFAAIEGHGDVCDAAHDH